VQDRIAEHREFVEACRAHDPDAAAAALQRHLRHTFEAAIARLREVEAEEEAEEEA